MNSLSSSKNRYLFRRGPGLGLKALTLLLVCGALMAAELDGERLSAPRQWLSTALTPIVWLNEVPTRVGGIAEHFRSRKTLMRENAALKQRQLQLEAQLQKYAALNAENRRMRQLMDASKRLIDNVAIVDILSTNHDPYRQQVTLGKGQENGVYRGQALVDANGVLGQVIQLGKQTSVALLVTDPNHGIPVEVNRTGLQAIALGQGSGQPLRIPFLPANADIEPGDLIVSSSLGGRFPAGFPVARVAEVKRSPGGHFKEVLAVPAGRVGHGRQALLVWSERPVIDPAQANDAIAAEAFETGETPPDANLLNPAPLPGQ